MLSEVQHSAGIGGEQSTHGEVIPEKIHRPIHIHTITILHSFSPPAECLRLLVLHIVGYLCVWHSISLSENN